MVTDNATQQRFGYSLRVRGLKIIFFYQCSPTIADVVDKKWMDVRKFEGHSTVLLSEGDEADWEHDFLFAPVDSESMYRKLI